jgi:hypothetical protein
MTFMHGPWAAFGFRLRLRFTTPESLLNRSQRSALRVLADCGSADWLARLDNWPEICAPAANDFTALLIVR